MIVKIEGCNQRMMGILGGGLLGLVVGMGGTPAAIAQSCVAQTSCPNQPIQVTPGKWVNFEIVNRTSNIISIEQANTTDPIALSPGQQITLSGSTKDNASFLFWDVQGLSLQANVRQLAENSLRVELVWGNGFGHYALYLKDDGRIELL